MKERDFLKRLEQRANEQEQLIKNLPFPNVYRSIILWLGKHPWRLLIPFAFLVTLLLRILYGNNYLEFILRIFGGK